MFRKLSQKFNKRQKDISNQKSDNKLITDAVLILLNEELGGVNLGLKMEYSSKDKILSIIAPSKIIASELSMRSEKIIKNLALKDFLVSRIKVT